MKTYIGIDLGGTNVRVAKVTKDGKVLSEIKRPSHAQEGPEIVLNNIMDMIKKIDNYSECSGIGIGVPGPVDTINGKMLMSTNLKGFTNYPIVEVLENEFNIPTFVDNDANVAGLAEALVGSGKGLPIVYYVTISTGIGGALIIDGKVCSGKNGHAGEIGNIIVKDNGKKINHLNAGAVENEASGTAVCRYGKELIEDYDVQTAKDVFDLARKGHEQALKIVDQMSFDLARMFSAIAHVCDPNIFIIGGGVNNARDLFIEKMKEYYNGMVHVKMRDVDFVSAKLEEPGIIGAAMLPVSRGL